MEIPRERRYLESEYPWVLGGVYTNMYTKWLFAIDKWHKIDHNLPIWNRYW